MVMRSVYLADDDIDDIELFQVALEEVCDSCTLTSSKDGIDLLKKLSALNALPEVVFIDVNMPMMNGKEALLKIRQMDRYQKIPVVLFTTSSTEFDRNFATRYNAGFVTKPLDNRQMKNITDQFIEHCTDEVKRHIRKTYS